MKLLQLSKLILALAVVQLFFVSCEEDGTIGGGGGGIFDTAPTVNLESGMDLVTDAVTLMPGETFTVRLSASGGTNDMNAVSILEDGAAISDLSRISVDGTAPGANPFVLFGADRSGFTKDIQVRVADVDGFYIYTFEVVDEGSSTSDLVTVSVTIASDAMPPNFTNMTSGMIDADAGSLISIPIVATAGSVPMAFISVTENEDVMSDLNRLYYGDLSNNFTSNPYPLPDSDRNMIDTDLFIRVPTDPGLYTYQVFILDENNEAGVIQFDVTVPQEGTPVDFLFGQLLNAAGPVGQGGLDLDEGISTGSDDPMAEIKDNGIDIELPGANNWRQQIAGTNGSEVRYLIAGQNGLAEGFGFNSVMFKEQLVEIFDNGVPFSVTNDSGEMVSNIVNVGDLFIVRNGSNYYMINVTDISLTDSDNNDSYTMDILR